MMLAAAAVAWTVLIYKLRHLRRGPRSPFLQSYCFTVAMIALTFTVSVPPVLSRIEQTTGILAIWITGFIVMGCAGVQTTLLLWAYPAEHAWRKIRPRWIAYTVAVIVMLALAVAGRIDPTTVNVASYAQSPELLWARTPLVLESTLLYIAALGHTSWMSIRLYWRLAGMVDRRWLRRGLRILAVGAVPNFGYCVAIAAFLVTIRLDHSVEGLQTIPTVLSTLGVMISAIGATMPAWGPRVDRLVAYHRLHPLWVALYQATPEVVLDPPASVRTDRWNIRDLNFRLYRRVIEIRDSTLALRPYRDRHVANHAERLARDAGLKGVELKATVEAAVLASAIRAKAHGRTATQQSDHDDTSGGDDLAAELAWFTLVARAFAGSAIVIDVASLAEGEGPDPAAHWARAQPT